MRVAMVGLGKLGLPVAYALGSRGVEVFGHDPHVWHPPEDASHEQGLAEAIEASEGRVHFCQLVDAVNNTDGVVFVATQTPHEPRFEGVTPLPDERADFDYTYLIQAVQQVAHTAAAVGKDITIAVISTVLPGTLEREIVPLLPDGVRLVYNPSFIAMGTTVRDFLDPEFVLLGGDDGTVRAVYDEAYYWPPKVVDTTIRNAELIKVAYNTAIGLKIVFANALMEICHKTGGDVDEVTGALKMAHRRVVSTAYMDGGMGDGGACHPRDGIALSWLARELDLSYDLFESVMTAREKQARWLWWLLDSEAAQQDEDRVGLLGVAYKPGSSITTGSAALLVLEFCGLNGDVVVYDPYVPGEDDPSVLAEPRVWLVGCRHPEFVDLKLPKGSVVVDPFRFIPDQEGVTVVRVGEASGGRRGVSAPEVRAGTVGSQAA